MKKIIIVLGSFVVVLLVVLILLFKDRDKTEIVERTDYGSKLINVVNKNNVNKKIETIILNVFSSV